MKRTLYLSAFLIFYQCLSFGQGCLPDGIDLLSQSQIDNFQTDNPGCTEIEGDVWIEGDDIVDLSGLNEIIKIHGSLFIWDCIDVSQLKAGQYMMK